MNWPVASAAGFFVFMGRRVTMKMRLLPTLAGLGLFVLACGGASTTTKTATTAPSQPARVEATAAPVAASVATVAPTNPPAPTSTTIPKPTATRPPLGSGMSNPANVGDEVTANEFKITVKSIVRPADKVVAAGNMFNTKPEADQEYVQVILSVTCGKAASEKCTINPFSFKVFGSEGIARESKYLLAGVTGMLESTEFLGGATIKEKSVFFLVGKTETKLALNFEAGFINPAKAFIALPDKK